MAQTEIPGGHVGDKIKFGAASQLEKIDMLDFAEFVAINKFDRKGSLDALRDVAKQVQRNKEAWGKKPDEMPVFGTMAARFNDDGVTALYQALKPRLAELGLALQSGTLPVLAVRHSTNQSPIVPAARTRYLAEISETITRLEGPVIIAGDFNATPYTPAFQALLKATRTTTFTDFPATFPATMGPLGIPIDHVLVGGIRLADLRALPPIGSDHLPLKALLFLPTTNDGPGLLWDAIPMGPDPRASGRTSH